MAKDKKSKVKCPRCRNLNFCAVKRIEFGIELFSIGPNGEIIPIPEEHPFELEKMTILRCYNCGWEGTPEEYFEEKSGIIRIYTGEENVFDD